MKKLLLILIFLTTSLFSFQVDMWQEGDNAVLNFNKYYNNIEGDEGTNWIAIYKAGDSNDWGNVITWAWAKDLAHNEAGNYDERVFPLVTNEGSYEIRFFLNNSYDVFATYSYINGGNGNNASLGIADINSNSVIFNNTTANEAWIGIYKKGNSNDWDNVKAWNWVTSASTTIDISNLDGGGTNYEARLFYNNSYDVEASSEFTKNGNGDGYPKVTREELDVMIANGEDYSKVDVSGITDMSKLFLGKEVKYDITGWNVSNVNNMHAMFSRTKYFNQDISNWDVSSVIYMSQMFLKSTLFNQPIGNWNISNAIDISSMFENTESFNQPIGNWDVSSVTTMRAMFNDAKSFNQPIGSWNVSNVHDMAFIFYHAIKFNQDISSWDTTNVYEHDWFSFNSALQDKYKPLFK